MNNTLILIVAFFLSSTAYSENFNIRADLDSDHVQVIFSTKKTFPSMCSLENTKVQISRPHLDRQRDILPVGQIEVSASNPPHGICLAAFGPHSGSLKLYKGSNLPQISEGIFDLYINGIFETSLRISKDNVEIFR